MFPDNFAWNNLYRQIQVLYHLFYHQQLLIILFTKNSKIRLHEVKQF